MTFPGREIEAPVATLSPPGLCRTNHPKGVRTEPKIKNKSGVKNKKCVQGNIQLGVA